MSKNIELNAVFKKWARGVTGDAWVIGVRPREHCLADSGNDSNTKHLGNGADMNTIYAKYLVGLCIFCVAALAGCSESNSSKTQTAIVQNPGEKSMSFYNGIVTSKLQESKEFYTKNLKFSVKFENEWFVLLERNGRELAFMQPDLKFQNQIFRGEYAGKGLWLTFEVANVETELKRIKKLGIPIAVEIRQEEWGETHFSVLDPNGIGLDFVKYKAP